MRKDIAVAWIHYLSTGKKYKTIAKMREDRARCPLGHLCDLYHALTGQGLWEQDAYTGKWFFVDAQNNRGHEFLPRGVAQWAGIEEPDFKRPIGDNEQEYLSDVSDTTAGWRDTKRVIEQLGAI